MLGPAKSRRLDAPIAVSLEDLVPADNFYRHVEATLDLSFVREWVQELYAERGRPSIDPVPRSSPQPTSWRARRCGICCGASASSGRSGRIT
jgi:hypothetical protein